jgi:hypothetical protein
MDYKSKAIYADSLVVISLELYLGKNHKFYQFPNYLKQNFEQRQIARYCSVGQIPQLRKIY